MDQAADRKEDQPVASQRPGRRSEPATISAPTTAGPYFAGRSPYAFLLVLALIGTFATGFLTYRHIVLTSHFGAAGESALCPAHGNVNCDAILMTDYAVLFRYFSSAALGLAGFVLVLWLLVNALFNERIRKLSWACLVVYFFAAIGFSWYFAYIMVFEVDFICTWCIVVHVLNVISLIFVIIVSMRKRKEFLLPEISTFGERAYFVVGGVLISLSIFLGSGLVEKSLSFDDAKAKYEEIANDPVVISAMLNASENYQIPVSARDPVYGSSGAPYPIIFFGDFQCPVCAGMEKFVRRLVDINPGVLKLVYKNYPLSLDCNPILLGNPHPMACTAARAGYAAFLLGGPTSFWRYANLLFENRRHLNRDPWSDFARRIGLEPRKFQPLMGPGGPAEKKVKEDIDLGIKLKLSATPQIFFEGKKIPENLKGEFFIDTLEQLVRGHHPDKKDFKLKRR